MGSMGASRKCAIKSFKDEEDGKGKLGMSCMEPVRDGARISISDSEAVEVRAGVIEWLMTNHPHDCAIGDEGVSCHFQEMIVMSRHNYLRFIVNKRTTRKTALTGQGVSVQVILRDRRTNKQQKNKKK